MPALETDSNTGGPIEYSYKNVSFILTTLVCLYIHIATADYYDLLLEKKETFIYAYSQRIHNYLISYRINLCLNDE